MDYLLNKFVYKNSRILCNWRNSLIFKRVRYIVSIDKRSLYNIFIISEILKAATLRSRSSKWEIQESKPLPNDGTIIPID
jgi:hypothetical protein